MDTFLSRWTVTNQTMAMTMYMMTYMTMTNDLESRCCERLDAQCILHVVCTVWFHALMRLNQRGDAAQDKHTGVTSLSFKHKVTTASKQLNKQGAVLLEQGGSE